MFLWQKTTWFSWLALLPALILAPGTHYWHGVSHWLGIRHAECHWQQALLLNSGLHAGQRAGCCCHGSPIAATSENTSGGLDGDDHLTANIWKDELQGICLLCQAYLHVGLNSACNIPFIDLRVCGDLAIESVFVLTSAQLWPPARGPPQSTLATNL